MNSTHISSRTQVGQEVLDGHDRLVVTHRIADSLVLKSMRSGEFYVRHIEGGSKRCIDEQSAIDAAVLPYVATQVAIAHAGA